MHEEDTHTHRREVDLQPLSMTTGGSLSICVHLLYDVGWYVELRSFILRFDGRTALLQKLPKYDLSVVISTARAVKLVLVLSQPATPEDTFPGPCTESLV